MGRVYLNVGEQRDRLRLLRQREGLDDSDSIGAVEERTYIERRPPAEVGFLERAGLTWERILLGLILAWFLWKFVTRGQRMARDLRRLKKQVKKLAAPKGDIIDV